MSELGKAFIAQSQFHLAEDFLPKIERCVNLLKDDQIWWRPNQESNSIGNLLLHLTGNVRQWIVCGLGDATDARDRDSEFAQREMIPGVELFGRLKQTVDEAHAVLGRLDSNGLHDVQIEVPYLGRPHPYEGVAGPWLWHGSLDQPGQRAERLQHQGA